MQKQNKDLSITKTYDLAKPAEVVAMAITLKNYVVKQQLYTNIKGKNYAHVDGWQFAGFLSGINVMVEEPKNLSTDKEIKWSVEARIYQGDKIIGRGYALCSNKEAIKKGFDEYAILSMAQTRAIGKAYRNKIGWIMKLAGYEATPSEEMVNMGGGVVDVSPASKNPTTGQETAKNEVSGAECASCGNPLTKAEADFSKKIFKKQLCRNCQKEVKRQR